MKNLNVKPYQAYHPYNNLSTTNQRHYNQQNQQQQQHLNHQQQYHHQQQQQQQQQQQHHSQLPNQQLHFNSYTAAAAATAPPTQRYTNNSYTPSVSVAANTDSIDSPHASTSQTPPTLGGYLANQQHLQQHQQQQQQQQQQQLRLQQTYNHQQQQSQSQSQQQHQTSPLTPTQLNMLSLNQNNTYNYNFHFNAICGGNSQNNGNSSSSSSNNSNNNHLSSNFNININNTKPSYHNNSNSALSRPQRPNSLNIAAMASLAIPPTVSGSTYSLTPAAASATAATIRSNSATPLSAATAAGGSGNLNKFFQQRENVFNFSPANAHNYLQQSFNNYNNIQQQQHQQQQQQHHHQLQQFQLLQQQLKQQQQQQQLNNISEHFTPAASATSTTTIPTPLSSSTLSTTSSNGSNSNLPNIAAVTTASANNNSNAVTNQTNNNTATNQSNNNNNNNSSNNCDRLAMDACEIANFLANELFMQQLVNMECMPTGVPTLTTPTLTPTTLRSIEESFIQLTSEPPLNAPYQAGFIPPPLGSYNNTVTTTNSNTNATTIPTSISNNSVTVGGLTANVAATVALNNVYLGDISAGASLHDYGNLNDSETEENSQESWNDQNLHEENSLATTDNSSAATDTASFQNGLNGLGVSHLNNSNSSTTNDFTTVNLAALAVATAAAKMSSNSAKLNSNTSSSATTYVSAPPRRGGGRRPAANTNMSPEEEEKRRVRRERNKLAAARCRKRRVDQTNELTDEVSLLERKREELQKQIEALNGTKQDLEFILEAHRPTCQRVAPDILSVNNFSGLGMTTSGNDNITGIDTTLASTARSNSPLDLKPVLNDQLLSQIKAEPLDSTLDSSSSLDGPPSPKKLLLSNNNPMIPPPLPNVATLSASLAAASASLNTPIVTTAPVSFGSVFSANPMLNRSNSKQRPNTLPTVPRNLAQSLGLNIPENKPPTDINGVAIQTPSTGMFNFDSLMDGGTGLTPVSGPLVPTCSSQNKHPLELVTPTSEPSKLVSL